MKDVRIAIIGCRHFTDYKFLVEKINELADTNDWNIVQIISGAARGADTLARQLAKKNNIDLLEFPADWDKHGKLAGFMRNSDIVNNADVIVAFWDYVSNGTRDSINKAKEAKKEHYIVGIPKEVQGKKPKFAS